MSVTPIRRDMRPRNMTALALTAGGSRGAYQAGVLKRIGEVSSLRDAPAPFDIIAGASAGAINGSAIAARGDRFVDATRHLSDLWAGLTADQVYRTDMRAFAANASRLALDVVQAPFGRSGLTQSLLDARPLRRMLQRELPAEGLRRAVESQRLYALAITATGYHSGKSYTFIEGQPGHPIWQKSRRVSLSTSIDVDHVCASAAIPTLFRPVPLSTGGSMAWFGDGAMRLTNPLSPAIRLGAKRILAIGIRCPQAAQQLTDTEMARYADRSDASRLPRRPPLAQICGTFLNAIFLDHLDADLDHLMRMNELVKTYGRRDVADSERRATVHEPMRVIEPLVVAPSQDFAEIAESLMHRVPLPVRVLLQILGNPDPKSADLTSYLLFDPEYTRALIDIGYRDADDKIDEIEAFLRSDRPSEYGSRQGRR